MKSLIAASLSLVLGLAPLAAQTPLPDQDPLLRAMVDELDRARALRLVNLDKPYYISYSLEDADVFVTSATLGSLLSASRNRARIPQVNVRVGSYEFDNSNYVYSAYTGGARYDPEQWPLDGDYGVLRQAFWLATDRTYKAALEVLARKRASLKTAAEQETLPDFAKAEPVRILQPARRAAIDQDAWKDRVAKLSLLFAAYPELHRSTVSAQVFQGIAYFADSEGTVARNPEGLFQLEATASVQAADGMLLHDAAMFPAIDPNGVAPDAEVRRAFTQVAENVRALLKAPIGESYAGPVLFEGTAAAQLLAQVMGDNLRIPRRPVSDRGRPAPYIASQLESRLGSRVLPEWMDIVDDPTQKEWRGNRLLGHYSFDMEGVPPSPVTAVEKGVLKGFLTTRQVVKDSSGSNGHARLSGAFGARSAAISNLFVNASQTKPAAQLKSELMEMIQQRGKPYGMIVRKLDYPSSASARELRTILTGMAQAGGSSRPVSPPVLVYRVYPDGREELVRGMRFRGLSVRTLRDIVSASQENYVFNFVNNGAPFAMMGSGGFLAPTTVVAPALLFDEVELDRAHDELSKPPIVPPPPIEAAAAR